MLYNYKEDIFGFYEWIHFRWLSTNQRTVKCYIVGKVMYQI